MAANVGGGCYGHTCLPLMGSIPQALLCELAYVSEKTVQSLLCHHRMGHNAWLVLAGDCSGGRGASIRLKGELRLGIVAKPEILLLVALEDSNERWQNRGL